MGEELVVPLGPQLCPQLHVVLHEGAPVAEEVRAGSEGHQAANAPNQVVGNMSPKLTRVRVRAVTGVGVLSVSRFGDERKESMSACVKPAPPCSSHCSILRLTCNGSGAWCGTCTNSKETRGRR